MEVESQTVLSHELSQSPANLSTSSKSLSDVAGPVTSEKGLYQHQPLIADSFLEVKSYISR